MGRALTVAPLLLVAIACSESTPAAPRQPMLQVVLGDSQVGIAGRPLPLPVVVRVVTDGVPFAGAPVRFTPSEGSVDQASAITDATGYAHVTWTLGADTAESQTLSAALDDSPTETITVVARARAFGSLASIEVLGPASDQIVLPGDTVHLIARPQDAFGEPVPATLTWGVSDSTVATISANGVAVARALGTTQVLVWGTDARGMQAAGTVRLTVADRTPVWQQQAGSSLALTPAVADDGNIYYRSPTVLYAITGDGTPRWNRSVASSTSYPAVDAAGNVYLVAGLSLVSYDPGGGLRWSMPLSGPFVTAGSPAIAATGRIYLATRDTLLAFGTDGSVVWRTGMPGLGTSSSPAIASDGTVYVALGPGCLSAVRPADGSVAWSYCGGGGTASGAPAVGGDGTVYFGTGLDLLAVRPDGSLKWRIGVGAPPTASPAIGPDGTVYVTTNGGPGLGGVYAVEAGGSLRWYYPASYTLSPPTVGANGTVYVGRGFGNDTFGGAIFAINPDGSRQWFRGLRGTAAAPATITDDGLLVIGSSDGLLHALRIGQGLADSPWPKFQGDRGNRGQSPP